MKPSLRAKRRVRRSSKSEGGSNPCRHKESVDCFVARAPRNDGVSCWQMGPIHVFASTAKQSMPPHKESMDCFVARAPRNDGVSCWQMGPIHVFASTAKQSIPPQRKYGLLRRFRLRSLSFGGQAAPRNDGKIRLRDPAAQCARVVHELSAP